MTKYNGFQYSVTYGTAVTRMEVRLWWRNQCETVQTSSLQLCSQPKVLTSTR